MGMSEAVVADQSEVLFTDSAAAKVRELLDEESNPALKLRVFVTGGGCSGFKYGFTFDENTEDGDLQVQNGGVTLLEGVRRRVGQPEVRVDPEDEPDDVLPDGEPPADDYVQYRPSSVPGGRAPYPIEIPERPKPPR